MTSKQCEKTNLKAIEHEEALYMHIVFVELKMTYDNVPQ